MSIGQGWYATNQSRSFPLHATATTVADNGKFLPEDLIVDLKLRYPGDFDNPAYISYVSSGEMISIAIATGTITLATATVPRNELRAFPVVALQSTIQGVQGFIVFGPSASYGTWRFSGPDQSQLSQRAAYPQVNLDQSSRIHRRGSSPGTGPSVDLTGNGDVLIARVERQLAGELRSAISLSLNTQSTRNVLQEYAGQCGRRPESATCGNPAPIESINGVVPDCCGRIFIEFRGCAEIIPIANACGIVLRCDITAADVCPVLTTLPDENGNLPNTGEDTCEDGESPTATNEQEF